MPYRDREPAVAGNMLDPARAWAAYEPDAQRPWDLRRAAHLYRRVAFGANWSQLQQALADGPQRTIDRLLAPDADVAAFNHSLDDFETSASADATAAWWLRRMIQTPHPLLEKMTLFWHNHFAISGAGVEQASLIKRHVQLLRNHALGRFDLLLEAVSRDPATLIALDASTNRKAQPNENYARSLLEQFSLGSGHYREEDIQEAARAFTGWFVLQNQFRYLDREHDPGVKEVLGQKGNLHGEDVIQIVLRQAATPRWLIRRLYRWLISETAEPGDALIGPLADSFAEDYNVAGLVETMLRSNWFFSPSAYRQRVKSPVEFALGIIHGLEGIVSTARLDTDLASLGQRLLHPPLVKGWPGGRHWINRATLIGRNNLALALLSGTGRYGGKLDPLEVAGKYGFAAPDAAGRFLFDLFVQQDVPRDVREALLDDVPRPANSTGGDSFGWLRRFAHLVVTLPEFQLA